MAFTDQLVKPFVGHTGETGDVVHVDQGSSARSNTLSWPVIEVNMVRMSFMRFMKVVQMRINLLNGVFRAGLLRDTVDYRRGNGLPDRAHHDDRGRNH